jgi:hypothetical protein
MALKAVFLDRDGTIGGKGGGCILWTLNCILLQLLPFGSWEGIKAE